MNGLIPVHLRVNDAATGKPTPVRLRITDEAGRFFAPFGRSADFPTGRAELVGGYAYLNGEKYCYIDGACEIYLPPGVPLNVVIKKGIEYTSVCETVTLGPGQMALRFQIERWIDIRSTGWVSADTRCHFLTPHDALLEAAAEDVDIVQLLATECDVASMDGHLYRTVPNLTSFSGQKPLLEVDGRKVVVNTFNTHPALGRVALLHSHRPVFPLSFGDADGSDDWSLCDWCDQCHRKGGLTVWCDAFRPEAGLLGGGGLIALVLGKIDAIEFDAGNRSQSFFPSYYRLLNAGFRVPLVGASGKTSNREVVGRCRTYTKFPEDDRSLGAWIGQIRQGKTFVTNGPLVDVFFHDWQIGATGGASSPVRIEVVLSGKVVVSTETFDEAVHRVEPETSGWIAVRCRGRGKSPLDLSVRLFAHSSPIWLDGPFTPKADDVRFFRERVEETQTWIQINGRFADPRRKEKLLKECDDALAVLQRKLEEGADS